MKRNLLFLAFFFLLSFSARATVYYVDGSRPDNTGNGQSWADAKKDVQAAINAAAAGDEIWVKAGTYLPTLDPDSNASPTDPRDKTFYITTKDVKLYGGFSGNETLLSQRNPTTNVTTLSGDLDGGGNNDAYHVLLTIGRTYNCVIDGFTITGGRANGSGNLVIITLNETIDKSHGGGMHNYYSSPTVSNCVFSSNTGSLGGGMFNFDNSNTTVSNCVFSSNTGSLGGGMYNNNSSPAVSSCVFSANTASNNGGGMYNSFSSLTISDCVFSANATANNGGGMCNTNSSSSSISSCTFSSNTANVSGGGISNFSGSHSVSSCTFSFNTANFYGGGIYNNGGSHSVSSCTFSANTASSNGGGFYYTSNAGGSITNSILYGNTGGPVNRQNIYKTGTGTALTVSYSLIGDYSATATNNYTSGLGIIAADPLFVNAGTPAGADGVFRTADDGLRLQGCSPAINAGNGTTPTTDISGNGRVGAMDLGAYEYQSSPAAPTLASGATTTDSSTLQPGSVVSFGGCGAAIAEVVSEGTQPAEGIISATMYVHATAPLQPQTQRAYVRRHYDISTILFPSTATARITLYFTQDDFDDYNKAIVGSGLPPLPANAADAANYANLRISQEHGTSPTGLPGSYSGWGGTGSANVLITPNVSWSSFLGLWKVQFPVKGFSGFFLTSAISTPLPLKLLAFNARRTGETLHQLDWSTGQEAAGTTFVVERSGDGQFFNSIGFVGGKEGGNSYRFEDKEPLPGANYYRLHLKEPGHAGYSQTLLLKGSGITTGDVRIMPNPATARVTIACTNAALEGSTASVWSAQGRMMAKFVLAGETILDVREWPVGAYLLRLADGTTLRLIKH